MTGLLQYRGYIECSKRLPVIDSVNLRSLKKRCLQGPTMGLQVLIAFFTACQYQRFLITFSRAVSLLNDKLGGVQPGFDGMVHIIVPEHPCPACNVKIAEQGQIIVHLFAEFLIAATSKRGYAFGNLTTMPSITSSFLMNPSLSRFSMVISLRRSSVSFQTGSPLKQKNSITMRVFPSGAIFTLQFVGSWILPKGIFCSGYISMSGL